MTMEKVKRKNKRGMASATEKVESDDAALFSANWDAIQDKRCLRPRESVQSMELQDQP